jgi:hypothetical protein
VLGLTLLSSIACASEYCTKEQYERDHAFIDSAISAGTLAKGPTGLRDSMLVHEGFWLDMNYPEQIAFMQRFACAAGGLSGKQLLYMDVRSLANGRLLATWTLGVLKPAEERPDPTDRGVPGVLEDENRIGLSGEPRADFIKSAIEECNKRSNSTTSINCPCYARAMADSVSIRDLKEMSAGGPGITVVRPKLEAAARRCQTN